MQSNVKKLLLFGGLAGLAWYLLRDQGQWADEEQDQGVSTETEEDVQAQSSSEAYATTPPPAPEGISEVVHAKVFCGIGRFESNNKFDSVGVHKDKYGNINELTFGWIQFAMGPGSLEKLLDLYIAMPGAQYAEQFKAYREKCGGFKRRNCSLLTDTGFHELLRQSASDPVMKTAQIRQTNIAYLFPAFEYGRSMGFQYPASYFILADSFVQRGAGGFKKDIEAARYVKSSGVQGKGKDAQAILTPIEQHENELEWLKTALDLRLVATWKQYYYAHDANRIKFLKDILTYCPNLEDDCSVEYLRTKGFGKRFPFNCGESGRE